MRASIQNPNRDKLLPRLSFKVITSFLVDCQFTPYNSHNSLFKSSRPLCGSPNYFGQSHALLANNGVTKASKSRSLRHRWCLCTFSSEPYSQNSCSAECTQVLSPFQAIIDFERKHGIPIDWINYAIRHSSPGGYWQRLERGEIKLDADFFKGFTADLHSKFAWKEFHTSFRNEQKKLKDTVNPTQLGDHVSLKAEAVDSEPTDQDRGARSAIRTEQKTYTSAQETERPSLSKLAKDTTIGDPVSLESEDVVVNTGKHQPSPGGTSKVNEAIVSPSSHHESDPSLPPIPSIDGEKLFWSMMSAARQPDPYVFPALEHLSKQKPRPILSALSNTVVIPSDHPWNKQAKQFSTFTTPASDAFIRDPRSLFNVYIASAEVGIRKPSRDIYELAINRLDEFDKQQGGSGIKAEDVVFLDDIGENLKTGKAIGMKTIRVQLGKTWRAVKELEGVLGTELMDETTRRSKL